MGGAQQQTISQVEEEKESDLLIEDALDHQLKLRFSWGRLSRLGRGGGASRRGDQTLAGPPETGNQISR